MSPVPVWAHGAMSLDNSAIPRLERGAILQTMQDCPEEWICLIWFPRTPLKTRQIIRQSSADLFEKLFAEGYQVFIIQEGGTDPERWRPLAHALKYVKIPKPKPNRPPS